MVMSPGVTTPVPSAKTPVRLTDTPAVTAIGLAVKLVITGPLKVNELHPVRTARQMPSTNTPQEEAVTPFIASPLTKTSRRISALEEGEKSREFQMKSQLSFFP
jgi:hypothetical protein